MELRVVTPFVELRYPDEQDLATLAALSAEEIHDRAVMPFSRPWTRAAPADRPANAIAHWRARRDASTPDHWSLGLLVLAAGEPVGVQAIEATDFAASRAVTTGSWLVRRVHGRGIGRAMRQAVVHFAFATLGAQEANSGSFVDNPASRRVSEVCGYEHAGTKVVDREGVPTRQDEWVLTRERWERNRRADIRVHGFDENWARRLGVRS